MFESPNIQSFESQKPEKKYAAELINAAELQNLVSQYNGRDKDIYTFYGIHIIGTLMADGSSENAWRDVKEACKRKRLVFDQELFSLANRNIEVFLREKKENVPQEDSGENKQRLAA